MITILLILLTMVLVISGVLWVFTMTMRQTITNMQTTLKHMLDLVQPTQATLNRVLFGREDHNPQESEQATSQPVESTNGLRMSWDDPSSVLRSPRLSDVLD